MDSKISPPSERPRLAFFGSDAIALPLLAWLLGEGGEVVELVGVVSQPDRPSGRGHKLTPNPVVAFARARGLPLLQPEKPDAALRAWLAEANLSLGLVMAYGHILRKAVLEIPRWGFLNLHGSLLPKLRGASPVETAIAIGETETGVSLMQMVRAMDAGPVADVERVPIDDLVTGGQLRELLAQACVPLLRRNLTAACAGELSFAAQPHDGVTYCRKLSKSDGQLDFHEPAEALARRIRGLAPWPGCFADHGSTRLKLGFASAEAGPSTDPSGTILSADDSGIRVATGSGVLNLTQLQRPGGKMMPASDFLRGYPLVPADQIKGGLMPNLLVDS